MSVRFVGIVRPLVNIVAAWVAVCVSAVPGRAESEGPISKSMAGKLGELRTEIHELDATLRSRRAESAASLRGLAARLGELQAQEGAVRLEVKSLEAELGELKTRGAEQDRQTATLYQAVMEAIGKVEAPIRSGLPFKLEDRLGALSRLRNDLKGANSTPADAGARLWRFIEDERRLASTVEQAEIALSLGAQESPTLVRVVRVGLVALFVHRPKGGFGKVVRDGQGAFGYAEVTDSQQSAQIGRLFSATDKQIREGRYLLPILGKGVRLP